MASTHGGGHGYVYMKETERATCQSKSSDVTSRNAWSLATPALLTRRSMWPSDWTALWVFRQSTRSTQTGRTSGHCKHKETSTHTALMSGYWKLDSDMVIEVTTVIIVVMGEKLAKKCRIGYYSNSWASSSELLQVGLDLKRIVLRIVVAILYNVGGLNITQPAASKRGHLIDLWIEGYPSIHWSIKILLTQRHMSSANKRQQADRHTHRLTKWQVPQ